MSVLGRELLVQLVTAGLADSGPPAYANPVLRASAPVRRDRARVGVVRGAVGIVVAVAPCADARDLDLEQLRSQEVQCRLHLRLVDELSLAGAPAVVEGRQQRGRFAQPLGEVRVRAELGSGEPGRRGLPVGLGLELSFHEFRRHGRTWELLILSGRSISETYSAATPQNES